VRLSTLGRGTFFAPEECSIPCICIPSSIKTIVKSCFRGWRSLSTVALDSGSKLSSFEKSLFRNCSSLRSICIPSSIATISTACFEYCTKLSSLTFEAGSQTSTLDESGFALYSSLQSICLPAGLRQVTGLSFASSRLESVFVEAMNPFSPDFR
jgi:hypothetical protein